ncbi:MAG: hypothetical protein Q8O01_07830, partial [Candidatus Omnitrophota bacterium]|nr:hypothetical protein [Candidatus Omnitrophota bacterium]
RIRELIESQGALKKEMEFIQAKAEEAEALVKKLEEDLKIVLAMKSERLQSLEEKNLLIASISKEIEESEEKIKVSKIQTVEYLSRETRTKNELIKLGADLSNRKARQRRLLAEKETVGKELESSDAALAFVIKECEDVERKISGIRSDLDAKKSLKSTVVLEFESIQAEISQEENKRTFISSKIELLEDAVKKHEGFYHGVKDLLTRMDEKSAAFTGILGVVADMIKVEKGYEEAVDTFLGDNAQILVTQNDSDITSAIEYLKTNRLGKAGFISLETLRKLKISSLRGNAPAPRESTPLLNYVNIDPRYQDVLDHLLANAHLTESLENVLSDSGLPGAIVITKSGLMYNNGTVSGGSGSDGEEVLLIGRKNKLESLRASSLAIDQKLALLKGRLNENTEASCSLDSDISSLESAFRAEEINISGIKMRQLSHSESAKRLKEEYDVANLELEEVGQIISELSKNGETLNTELNEIEKNKSGTENLINEFLIINTDRRSKKEKLGLEIATLAAENQSVDKEEESLRNRVEKEDLSVQELKTSLFTKEGTLNDYILREKLLTEEIAQLRLQNGAISSELKILSEESLSVEKERSNIVDALGIDELQLKDREEAIDFLRNQIRDLDVKLTEISYKKANLKER